MANIQARIPMFNATRPYLLVITVITDLLLLKRKIQNFEVSNEL